MKTPIFPQEWLNLRLEFTEEYLLKRERIKQMQEFKNREIQKFINNRNDGSILKRPTPHPNVKELDDSKKNDYYNVIEDYDLNNKKKSKIWNKIKDCWH